MGVLARFGSLEVMYIFEFLPRYPDQIFEQMDLEESYFIDIITFNFPKTLWRFNFIVVILNIPWAIFLFVRFILTCVFHVVGRTFENNFKNFNPIFIERKRRGK